MLKKIAAVLAAGLMGFSLTAAAESAVKVFVDEVQLAFDVEPIIDNGRTLVPMRAIFEALGAEVAWNQETRTVTAERGDDVISITIDSNALYKNDEKVEIDVPAKIVDGRTLVPIRAVSNSFDAEVNWDKATQSVLITTEKSDTPVKTDEPADDIFLTEEDIGILSEMKEEIRYQFEQSGLPQELFENSDTIYDTLENEEKFGEFVYGQWTITTTAYAVLVATASETTYEMGGDGDILGFFSGSVREAGLDADSVFEGVTCTQTENGTRIGVVEFKTVDNMVDCKYLGIAASEDGAPRYFTAENDPFYPDEWYFCEVSEESRGILTLFKKTDAETDINNFVSLAESAYEGRLNESVN